MSSNVKSTGKFSFVTTTRANLSQEDGQSKARKTSASRALGCTHSKIRAHSGFSSLNLGSGEEAPTTDSTQEAGRAIAIPSFGFAWSVQPSGGGAFGTLAVVQADRMAKSRNADVKSIFFLFTLTSSLLAKLLQSLVSVLLPLRSLDLSTQRRMTHIKMMLRSSPSTS